MFHYRVRNFVLFVAFFVSIESADSMPAVGLGEESWLQLYGDYYRILRLSSNGGNRFIPKVASYDCHVIGGYCFDSIDNSLLPVILNVDESRSKIFTVMDAPNYITMESMSGDGKYIAGKIRHRSGKDGALEFAIFNLEEKRFVFVGDLLMKAGDKNRSNLSTCQEESISGFSFDGSQYVGYVYCGLQRSYDWACCSFYADARQRGVVKEIVIDPSDGMPFHVADISSNGCVVAGFKYCEHNGIYKSFLFSNDEKGNKIIAICEDGDKSLFATSISPNGRYVAGRSKDGFWIWDVSTNGFSCREKSYRSFSPRFVSDDGKIVAGEMNYDDWTVRSYLWINGEFVDIMRWIVGNKYSNSSSSVVSMSPNGHKVIVLAGLTYKDMVAFLVERTDYYLFRSDTMKGEE